MVSMQRCGIDTRFVLWGWACFYSTQFYSFDDRPGEVEHWIGHTIVPWHISVGVLLLVLGLARASWARTQRPRRVRHVGAIGPLVTAGHFLLYASMLLMPVAGLMLMLGKGYRSEERGVGKEGVSPCKSR